MRGAEEKLYIWIDLRGVDQDACRCIVHQRRCEHRVAGGANHSEEPVPLFAKTAPFISDRCGCAPTAMLALRTVRTTRALRAPRPRRAGSRARSRRTPSSVCRQALAHDGAPSSRAPVIERGFAVDGRPARGDRDGQGDRRLRDGRRRHRRQNPAARRLAGRCDRHADGDPRRGGVDVAAFADYVAEAAPAAAAAPEPAPAPADAARRRQTRRRRSAASPRSGSAPPRCR